MNPLDWGAAILRLQGSLDPNHQSVVENSMENPPRTSNDLTAYYQYSKYTVDGTHSSQGVNVTWKGLSPPSYNLDSNHSEVDNADGEPLEMDEEDPELARKRKELREIEEQILRKKASLALKKFVKTVPPDCNEQSDTCEGETLRQRVNVILQQRHSLGFLPKVRSPRNSSSLSKAGLVQEDHPLKLRVKALMTKRCRGLCELPTNMEVSGGTAPPPSQNIPSPVKENSTSEGFQRFLRVLNKGVDIDLLSRIVNDDSEDLPLGGKLLNVQPPAVDNNWNPTFRSQSQRSNSEASLQGHGQTNGEERKTDVPSPVRSHTERPSVPDNKKNDREGDSFNSSSRSKSPPTVIKKKEKEDGLKSKVDEQREQLQNVLKTLGLSLEEEEMSKLTDRTQERLYGKKHEGGQQGDSRSEQECFQKDRRSRNSSSSSCSSSYSSTSFSSSRSNSRSFSLSPSSHRHSHSGDSEQRQTSQRNRSRDRSRTHQDSDQESKDAQRPRGRDKERKKTEKISAHQHPYPQDQTYPHPHPAAFSDYLDYNLSSEYSRCTTYHSGNCSTATDSSWTQGPISPSLYPSEYSYPHDNYHQFAGPVAVPKTVHPNLKPPKDINFHVNPDLSSCEGQIGPTSGIRCLQVISTMQSTTQRRLKPFTKPQKRTRNHEYYQRKRRSYRQKRKQKKKKALTELREKLEAEKAKKNKRSNCLITLTGEGK